MPSLKIRQPKHRTLTRARVTRVERPSPHFVTVTLRADALGEFEYLGHDQAIRVFFPRRGQDGLRMPNTTGNGWLAKIFLIPVAERPHVRNYTIRACRPDAGEVDVEFVVHGDAGPASYWATRVRPGDEAGLFPEGIQYLPPRTAGVRLLAADESALPAVLAILDHSPADLRAEVFLEVPAAADIRVLPERPGVRVHWLPRDESDRSDEIPGRLALEAVRTATLPDDLAYAFVAGESGLATGLRRHLVSDRGLPRSAVTFAGYWKHGRAAIG